MCEANLAQENGQLQCFFMVKHVTVWQPKHDRATKRDTNILWSNQYEHCFVQKYAVVCSKIRCCLFKNMFQNIGFKMFQTMCFFLCAQNVSPGIRSLFVEPVLKHDWANRLRRASCNLKCHRLNSSALCAKKLRKQMWKMQITEQNYRKNTCHITKIKRSHRNGGFKNVDANSKITYL